MPARCTTAAAVEPRPAASIAATAIADHRHWADLSRHSMPSRRWAMPRDNCHYASYGVHLGHGGPAHRQRRLGTRRLISHQLLTPANATGIDAGPPDDRRYRLPPATTCLLGNVEPAALPTASAAKRAGTCLQHATGRHAAAGLCRLDPHAARPPRAHGRHRRQLRATSTATSDRVPDRAVGRMFLVEPGINGRGNGSTPTTRSISRSSAKPRPPGTVPTRRSSRRDVPYLVE